MDSASQRPKGREKTLSTLNALIEGLNLAKEISSITPAKAAFGSVSALLVMIRDSMANRRDCVGLGISCADVCKALSRGLKGRRLDGLNHSILEAIGELTTTVVVIQNKIVRMGKRNAASQILHARNDRDIIAGWQQDLNRILQIFNTELAINIYMEVTDKQRDEPAGRGGRYNQRNRTQAITPAGELPPPAPRAFFGRDELIEKVVGMAVKLEPIALIGAGGVGKTSIALTVLHDDRVKQRFGENRRFIRCDQFPPSLSHFLARLSKAIGANVDNPEDLIPLRPILSSTIMFIIFDNIESIIDPHGTNSREILAVVDELCQFRTVCVCITSRITTVPRCCKRPQIPALSMEAAREIFYTTYGDGRRSDVIDNLLQRLDFHALSITLLAATASYNTWDYDRLAKEWNTHRARVLKTDHNESLAATVELSLASPTFRQLGSDARDLLGVVAFFPQGVDEKNLDRFFSTIPDVHGVFDKFCVLSLTYRNKGFVTMLAPIRDYLRPQDPKSSPLLCATRDHYFTRLSGFIDPNTPRFGETRWITSEDVNVEHLLDVFASVDMNSVGVWNACIYFMDHLYWHKPRRTILALKIEALPDDHHSKPDSLFELSRLFYPLGNRTEQKRLLTYALGLERQHGDEAGVAETLRGLSIANRMLKRYKEGISQAREGSEIFERLGNSVRQAQCLGVLAWLLLADNQLDAAETEASRMIDLIPESGQEYLVCQSHQLLGQIHRSEGEKEKAIREFDTALEIASRFDWHDSLFWNHYDLAELFCEDEPDNARAHAEQAKSHTVNYTHRLALVTELHARIWLRQGRLEDAKAGAFRALEIFEELGAAVNTEHCRNLLRRLEQ